MEHLETNMYLCTLSPVPHTSLRQVLLIAPQIDPSWLWQVTSRRKEFLAIHTFPWQNFCASNIWKSFSILTAVDDKMYRGDKMLSYVINASFVQNSGMAYMGDQNGASMMRNNANCCYAIADSVHWHCHVLFLSYHGSIIVVMLNFCFFINPFCFHSLTLIVVNKISNQIQVKMGYVRIL